VRYLALDLPKPVSKIGLGTWQFGSPEWGYGRAYAEHGAAEIVRRALELGITLFDTAEIYGLGRSERILVRALGEDRERAFVATKIYPVLPVAAVVVWRGARSARRIGVSPIDLYQVHWPNRLVGDGTTMRGMRTLQERGLVGNVGVSNYPLDRWLKAEAALGGRVLSNQVPYSLVVREPERDLIPHAHDQGRLVIAYSPLAQGFLSGRYGAANRPRNLIRRRAKLFRPDSFARAEPLLRTLHDVAAGHDATPSQVALAWTIRHPNVVAIPGASSVEQVESNAAASDLVLGAEEIAALDAAADSFSRP
jgi:aryl-alcohol dehydrogenase-like predicted oxidoreductase